MTAVFVHGNPEVAAVWDPLLRELGRSDVVLLSPPGFGAPVPDGFGATRTEYATWLARELEAMGEPVDLVGHDWGGGHVAAVAVDRPDLVRSWCIDVAGILHPDYVWHDLARVWQTAGDGEQAVAAMVRTPRDERARRYEGLGMPAGTAQAIAAGADEAMASCILALYRSAAQPAMAELGERFDWAGARAGLVVVATDDPFVGTPEMATEMARRAGAQVAVLRGAGHWWMAQAPAAGAAALRAFWDGLPG